MDRKSILTKEQQEQLKNMCENRVSVAQIGRVLNISERTVNKEIKALGIKKKRALQQQRTINEKNPGENFDERVKDFNMLQHRVEDIKAECKAGFVQGYAVIKMYADKVLLKDTSGFNMCLTYVELAIGMKE